MKRITKIKDNFFQDKSARYGYKFDDSIEYLNTIFKPLFLCFQETGNGTKDNRYPRNHRSLILKFNRMYKTGYVDKNISKWIIKHEY